MTRREHWKTRFWMLGLMVLNMMYRKPPVPQSPPATTGPPGAYITVNEYAARHGLSPWVVAAACAERRVVPVPFEKFTNGLPVSFEEGRARWLIAPEAAILPRSPAAEAAIAEMREGK